MIAAAARGVIAYARVKGDVGGEAADVLIGPDLVEKLGQHWHVADVSGGKLGGSDLQGGARPADFINVLLGRR